jgi:voltage-gated potassium channel
MHRPRHLIDGRVNAFLEDPASPRKATRVIIVLTVVTVLVGALVIWLFDPEEDFPDFATALWFTLQTVTTVGYGDVTPETSLGRLIAGVVMVVSIAFMTIVTALVTSTFVDAAQARRRKADTAARDDADLRLHVRIDEMMARLEAIESRIGDPGQSTSPPPPDPDAGP